MIPIVSVKSLISHYLWFVIPIEFHQNTIKWYTIFHAKNYHHFSGKLGNAGKFHDLWSTTSKPHTMKSAIFYDFFFVILAPNPLGSCRKTEENPGPMQSKSSWRSHAAIGWEGGPFMRFPGRKGWEVMETMVILMVFNGWWMESQWNPNGDRVNGIWMGLHGDHQPSIMRYGKVR